VQMICRLVHRSFVNRLRSTGIGYLLLYACNDYLGLHFFSRRVTVHNTQHLLYLYGIPHVLQSPHNITMKGLLF
jgi:hypothetical protein